MNYGADSPVKENGERQGFGFGTWMKYGEWCPGWGWEGGEGLSVIGCLERTCGRVCAAGYVRRHREILNQLGGGNEYQADQSQGTPSRGVFVLQGGLSLEKKSDENFWPAGFSSLDNLLLPFVNCIFWVSKFPQHFFFWITTNRKNLKRNLLRSGRIKDRILKYFLIS